TCSRGRLRSAGGRAPPRPPVVRRQARQGSTGPCPRPAAPAHNLPRAGGRRSEYPCEAILWTKRTFAAPLGCQPRLGKAAALPSRRGPLSPRASGAIGRPSVGSLERGTGSVADEICLVV